MELAQKPGTKTTTELRTASSWQRRPRVLQPCTEVTRQPRGAGSCPGRARRRDSCQAVPTGSCLWKRARQRAGGQGQAALRASPATHSAGHWPPPGGTIAPFTSAKVRQCHLWGQGHRPQGARAGVQSSSKTAHPAKSNPRLQAERGTAGPCQESCLLSPALAPGPSGKLPPAPLPQFPQLAEIAGHGQGVGCQGGPQPLVTRSASPPCHRAVVTYWEVTPRHGARREGAAGLCMGTGTARRQQWPPGMVARPLLSSPHLVGRKQPQKGPARSP